MIFYTLHQWLSVWAKLLGWPQSQPPAFKQIEQTLEKNSEQTLEGKVDDIIEPGKVWRIRHLATFWTARAGKGRDFAAGDYIKIVGRKGLILFIEPLEPDEQL